MVGACAATRYGSYMAGSADFISFDSPDEEGWIVARIPDVPGAMSQGRTREEATENVLDALCTMLTSEEKPTGLRWNEALVAYLHDRDLLGQEWVQEGVEQLRRGELVEREGGQGVRRCQR